jgi:hypothetical protein
MGLDVIQDLQALCFHELPHSKCLFGKLEKYLYNDCMIASKWFTISRIKKGLDS